MTAPRSGSFGGGLNPFGGGSLGDFGQYTSVGEDLANLAIYTAEVGWNNGTVSDTDYLAALQKAIDATDPGTHNRVSAVDKLDDAKYRIGRAAANQKGLDALIAFDQRSIATMNPDSLRYRTIADSLASELAQRRSRDYGVKVTEYNRGKGSTEDLLAWVEATRKGLAVDAPDKENWDSIASDLTERLHSEKDAKVYQDYQQHRMKGPAFLAYIASRRDSFDPQSPEYDDWSRKYEDAAKSVKDDAQATKDQAFFNSYANGKVGDPAYLRYLSARIKGMDPNDSSLPEWKQRLHQAAFSVAEDELRFKVQTGKAPVSALVGFYQAYRRGLNPNSPEYRQITRAIMSLGGASGGGGGGGGSRTGTGSTKGGGTAAKAVGKMISPKYTLDGVLGLLTVNPRAATKDRKVALAAFDANHTSLMNAVQRGDAQWVFYDPRHPGATIPLRDADGKVVHNAKGQTIMVPGSAYLPTSGTALANLDMLEANYHSGLAGVALSHHDAVGYFKEIAKASNAVDSARLHAGQQIARDNKELYKQVQDGIDLAMKTGDWASAVNLSNMLHDRISSDLNTPGLDDTRRAQLDTMLQKLTDNPLLPTDVDAAGRPVGGAIDWGASSKSVDPGTGRLVLTNVELGTGWHLSLDKTDANGRPNWGLTFDTKQDGTWEAEHVAVTTSYGGQPVRGEVKVGTAPVAPNIRVNTPDGSLLAPGKKADFISYTDENGKVVRAYSVDGGATWVKPEDGSIPVISVNVPGITKGVDPETGRGLYRDGNGNIVFQQGADGRTWEASDWFATNPQAVQFSGVDAARNALRAAGGQHGVRDPLVDPAVTGVYRAQTPGRRDPLDEGGPQNTVIFTGPDGSVDLSPAQIVHYDVSVPRAPRGSTGELSRAPAAYGSQRSLDRLEKVGAGGLLDAAMSFDREHGQAAMGRSLTPNRLPKRPPLPNARVASPSGERNVDRVPGLGLGPPPVVPGLTPRAALPGLPAISRRYEGAPPPLRAKAPLKPPVKPPARKVTKPLAKRPVVKPVVRSPLDQTTAARTGASKAI